MSDLIDGVIAVCENDDAYETGEQLYAGTLNEYFADPRVARKLARTGDAYRLNFAKVPVDVIAERLEISGVTVAGNDTMTKRFKDDIWDANQMDLHIPDFHKKAGQYGDGYLVVWPRTDVEGNKTGVDINFISPRQMRLFYSEENPRLKKYAIHTWMEGKRRRANLYYFNRVEKYITKPEQQGKEDSEWEPYLDASTDEFGFVDNPYSELPVYHLRNQFPYGRPNHADAFGPQNAINKLTATHMHTVDHMGWPQRVALMSKGSLDTQNDDPKWDDDEDAPAQGAGLDSVSNMRDAPDTIHELHGVDGITSFPAADPNALLTPAEFYIRAGAQLTESPVHRMFPTGDRPSGESLRVEEAPLIKKVRYHQMMYGATYKDAFEFAIFVLTDQRVLVTIKWAQPTTHDDSDSWSVAQQKQEAGVPKEHTLIEQGYEPEMVASWMKETSFDRQIAMLNAIGDAVTKLGAGVSLGILSEEQVRVLVDKLTADVQKDQGDNQS